MRRISSRISIDQTGKATAAPPGALTEHADDMQLSYEAAVGGWLADGFTTFGARTACYHVHLKD